MPDNKDFSVVHVPLARDACSCGVCLARNVPTANAQPREIYELRIGHSVTRLCASCLESLHNVLGDALSEIPDKKA